MARIEAILRRTSLSDKIDFKNLSLDKEKFQIWINQKLLEVTPIEFNLLDMFLTHQNHVFSREQIIEHIWGLTADVDNRTVDSHIRNLREKMRKESFDVDSFLLTVYGVGYKWQKIKDSKRFLLKLEALFYSNSRH